MRLCGQYRDNPPAQDAAQQLEKANQATIRYPVEGKLIGDWKEGEKLAAVGTGGHIGFIQPDPPGPCVAATVTPATSWRRRKWPTARSVRACSTMARLRGNSDDIVKYTYDKIYNSNAFTACTNMPRFGLHSWLTPEQITHIVAFLLDPESPVNKD
jgi:sulfur-oxidizing protein SoxX